MTSFSACHIKERLCLHARLFGKRAEKPSEIGAFRVKSGEFPYCNRSIALTDLRQERPGGAIAAPRAVILCARPAGRNRRNSGPSRHARANPFRKSEYALSSSSKAERKFARCKKRQS